MNGEIDVSQLTRKKKKKQKKKKRGYSDYLKTGKVKAPQVTSASRKEVWRGWTPYSGKRGGQRQEEGRKEGR